MQKQQLRCYRSRIAADNEILNWMKRARAKKAYIQCEQSDGVGKRARASADIRENHLCYCFRHKRVIRRMLFDNNSIRVVSVSE